MNEGMILIGIGTLLFGVASLLTAARYIRLEHEKVLFQEAREKYERALKIIEDIVKRHTSKPAGDKRVKVHNDEFDAAFRSAEEDDDDDKNEEGI